MERCGGVRRNRGQPHPRSNDGPRFCRRFDSDQINALAKAFNETPVKAWKQQPASFFKEAGIDADGTMIETTGECKEGMDINYTGEWGYNALMLSLANTGESLHLVNRPGGRLNHEHAAHKFDRASELCQDAGFTSVRLRGDTALSQTEHLDYCHDAWATCVFGIQASHAYRDVAEKLPPEVWKTVNDRPGATVTPNAEHCPKRSSGRRCGTAGSRRSALCWSRLPSSSISRTHADASIE